MSHWYVLGRPATILTLQWASSYLLRWRARGSAFSHFRNGRFGPAWHSRIHAG